MATLPPGDPDRQAVSQLVVELRLMYRRLAKSRALTDDIVESVEREIARAQALLDSVNRERDPAPTGNGTPTG